MWKKEFKRFFYNKQTLLIVAVFVLLGSISIYFSQQDKLMFINTLNENHIDIDASKLSQLIKEYNGMRFMLDYMFGDFGQITLLVMFFIIGIFYSPHMRDLIDSGYENLIVTRTAYRKHLFAVLKAQSLAISLQFILSQLIILLISYMIGGSFETSLQYGNKVVNVETFFIIIFIQTSIIILLSILINSLTILLSSIIINIRMIQLTPILFFFLVPLLISSTIGNLNRYIGIVFGSFVPWSLQLGLYQILHQQDYLVSIVPNFIAFGVYTLLSIFLLNINIKIYEENLL